MNGTSVSVCASAGSAHSGIPRSPSPAAAISPATGGIAAAGLVVYVSDVDQHYAQARKAGAQIDSQPVDLGLNVQSKGFQSLFFRESGLTDTAPDGTIAAGSLLAKEQRGIF